MNIASQLRVAFCITPLLLLPLAHAAPIGKDEYKATKSRISDTYKADKSACATQRGNAKDVCTEEAKGKEKVARAELEVAYAGTSKNQNKLLVAKADAAYGIAKEKCDDVSGNAKDVCRQQAKTQHTKALADAKLGRDVGAARTDAAETKRNADYKLAAEKCDALSGDAKSGCMNEAKRKFGKM